MEEIEICGCDGEDCWPWPIGTVKPVNLSSDFRFIFIVLLRLAGLLWLPPCGCDCDCDCDWLMAEGRMLSECLLGRLAAAAGTGDSIAPEDE